MLLSGPLLTLHSLPSQPVGRRKLWAQTDCRPLGTTPPAQLSSVVPSWTEHSGERRVKVDMRFVVDRPGARVPSVPLTQPARPFLPTPTGKGGPLVFASLAPSFIQGAQDE